MLERWVDCDRPFGDVPDATISRLLGRPRLWLRGEFVVALNIRARGEG
jgi:hypothetical protein